MHSYNSRRLNGRIYKRKTKIALSQMIAISELDVGVEIVSTKCFLVTNGIEVIFPFSRERGGLK